MPASIASGARIRSNIPAYNAYNALAIQDNAIASSQLRLSTGLRINSASDDVAGYITSRSLSSRNSALLSAQEAVGQAKNVTAISQDALSEIGEQLINIKQNVASASSGALGTDEKVALAKSAYRMAQQIQAITDSTVFGGKQLLQGDFSGDWTVGYYADDSLLELELNLSKQNTDYDLTGKASNDFNLNATSEAMRAAGGVAENFAAVQGLNLEDLSEVSSDNLGIFSEENINTTLTSLSQAITNVNKVTAYVGGIETRLNSQESTLNTQITNYEAAISRIQDADVAKEQMKLTIYEFLRQSSLNSLAQANHSPEAFLKLFQQN
jgi:flagellin